jgi:hypothetical protein
MESRERHSGESQDDRSDETRDKETGLASARFLPHAMNMSRQRQDVNPPLFFRVALGMTLC